MKPMRLTAIILFAITLQFSAAQQIHRDKGKFIESKNEYYDQIRKAIDTFNTPEKKPKIVFKMDFTGMELPDTIAQFTQQWHNNSVSQGRTGTCWCFSTTSFFESEIYRQTDQKLKLSNMYTVYWEYVEKATRFVRERGNSAFAEGAEANSVIRIWKKYGTIPLKTYTGLKASQEFHDHKSMYEEMNHYLENIKETNAWNEEVVLGTIKSILNHHLGVPPETIEVEGKKLTPLEYLQKVVRINLDDYVDFMSLLEKPYYKKVEYEVPDNWWHSEEYYNVPLDEFMMILKRAVRQGYTLDIGGDVSEPGRDSHAEVAMIPMFDIPSDYIDEYARQFRFSNKSTTDDHGIHLVGYMEKDGTDWYLIKDSGSGSHNGTNFGYYFYHEDYVKLKMMNILVHRSVAEDVLKRFQ
jgi:bleomycin hydrolase